MPLVADKPEPVSLIVERGTYGELETESVHFKNGTILWIHWGMTPLYAMWRDEFWREKQCGSTR